LEVPDDLPVVGAGPPNLPVPSKPALPSEPAMPSKPALPSMPASPSEVSPSPTPDKSADTPESEKPQSGFESLWTWLTDKLDEAKDSIKGLFGGS
jgi:hypothetical protein